MDVWVSFGGEIITNYSNLNAKFQGCGVFLILCDANSNFIMLED